MLITPGTIIGGQYRIEKKIGEGAMGIVFKALDLNLEKTLAIKMLKPEHAQDRIFIKEFQREVKILAQIDDHPNIIHVYNFLKEEIGWFIVIEYIEGESLSEYIRSKGKLTWKEAYPIMKQILSAVGHAHAHPEKIIHRDIKPGNIMLTKNQLVKVTDFGLAKRKYQSSDLTKTGVAKGTLYYMSPEQLQSPKEVDHRTDIYAIGITLFVMLTGKVPFDETEQEITTAMKIIEGKLLKPTLLNPNIDPKLEKIILKAVEKKADKRFQSTKEMLTAIEEYNKYLIEPKPHKLPFEIEDVIKWGKRTIAVLMAGLICYLGIVLICEQNDTPPVPEVLEDAEEVVTIPPEPESENNKPTIRDNTQPLSIRDGIYTKNLKDGDKLLRIGFASDSTHWKQLLERTKCPVENLYWQNYGKAENHRLLYFAPPDSAADPADIVREYKIYALKPGQKRIVIEQLKRIGPDSIPLLTFVDFVDLP